MASAPFSPIFIFGSFRIGSVEEASCVNLGNNYPIGFQNYKKHNQGFGNVGGDHNRLSGVRALVDDADAIETFGGEASDEIPPWVQEMIRNAAGTPAED